jgi:hypothetical protein
MMTHRTLSDAGNGRLNREAFLLRRILVISVTKMVATVLATEIMLLPGQPTDTWLVRTLLAAAPDHPPWQDDQPPPHHDGPTLAL